ncbi:MAG: NAD(P)/FAD-dependent oxidoreductase [Betaproteobacteria bacterium]
MTRSPTPPVVVIGAGIVGVCVAAWLQREGRQALLIDAGEPGMGASFGNGGILSASSIVPVAMPGVLRRVPGWLLDAEGPLTIRWSYLPRLAPWLVRFVAASAPARVERQARALRALLEGSLANYAPLVRDAAVEDLVRQQGMLYLYASEASWRSDARAMELRRRNGVAIEDLAGPALAEREPDLGPGFTRARLIPGNGHTTNPLRLVQKLAQGVVARGGRIVQETVVGFEHNGSRITAARTNGGTHPASAVVLAAGAWSRPLAAELGDRVPLDTERGYHAIVRNPEKTLRTPALYVDGNFGLTPMETGLRLVGTVELAGLDAPPDWARSRVLLEQAKRILPGLLADNDESRVSRWMGHRPSLPDSLPVIGPSSRYANAFYAFGHGHVGMCGASTTGKVVAELITGKPLSLDIAPFSARRF